MNKVDAEIADQLLQNQLSLFRFTASERKKVLALLDQMREELVGKLAGKLTSFGKARVDKLLGDSKAIIDDYYQKMNMDKKGLLDLAKAQAKGTSKVLVNVGLDAAVPTENVLRAMVSDTLIQGSPLKDWWAKQAGDTAFKFTSQVQQGIMQGETLQDIVTRVSGNKAKGIPGVLVDVPRRNASTLVHDMIMQVSNDSKMAAYKANSDIIKGYRQLSTLDSHTSDICIAYSGAEWDMDFKGKLPFNGGCPRHPNCRSLIMPITKTFRELGIDIDEIPKGTRASDLGQVPSDMTFDEFLKKHNDAYVDNMLGPGKAKLWREGKITLANLVNGEGRELTLTELQAKFGDPIAQKQVEFERQLKDLVVKSESVEEFVQKVSEAVKEEGKELSVYEATLTSTELPTIPKIIQEKGGLTQFYADVKGSAETRLLAKQEKKLIEDIKDPKTVVAFTSNQKLPEGMFVPIEGVVAGEDSILLKKATEFVSANKLNIEVESYTVKGIHKETVDFYKNKIFNHEVIAPVYVRADNISYIIDGNHRAAAYKELNIPVPIVKVSYKEGLKALMEAPGNFEKWYAENIDKITSYGKLKFETNENIEAPMWIKKGKQSAGMIVIDEETGKIWLCSPKNQFGGYKNTFPKGTVEPGSGLQNAAIKEVFEETGLEAKPLYHLGDYEKTTGQTRYYVGVKTGGNPTMFGGETEAVQLVPVDKLDDVLNVAIDQKIAKEFIVEYKEAMKLGEGNIIKGFEILNTEKNAKWQVENMISEYGDLAGQKKIDALNKAKIRWSQKKSILETDIYEEAQKQIGGWGSFPDTVEGKAIEKYVGKFPKIEGTEKVDYLTVWKNVTKDIVSAKAKADQEFLNFISESKGAMAFENVMNKNLILPETDPIAKLKVVKEEIKLMQIEWDNAISTINLSALDTKAFDNLVKEGKLSFSPSPVKEMKELVKKEASKINSKAATELAKESQSLLEFLPKEISEWNGWNFYTQHQYLLKHSYFKKEIEEAIKTVDGFWAGSKTPISKEVNDAYNKLSKITEKARYIKGLEAGKVAATEETVGQITGKLISNLSEAEQKMLEKLDMAVKGEAEQEMLKKLDMVVKGKGKLPWAEQHETSKLKAVELWGKLDTSVKKEYLQRWAWENASIPKELLGETEKALLKDISRGVSVEEELVEEAVETILGKKKTGKVWGDLTRAEAATINKMDSKVLYQEWDSTTLTWKKGVVDIWDTLDESMQKIYLDKWAEQKVGIPEELRIKAAPLLKIKPSIVKLGNTTYDLATNEGVENFNDNVKFHSNNYVKSVATGSKVTKTQQQAYDFLTENEKAAINEKIGTLKAKTEMGKTMTPVPSAVEKKLVFEDLVKYGDQEGSNVGGYYNNINNPSERYYVKTPANVEIAQNELLTSKLYQAAGVDVPDLQLIDVKGQSSIASKVEDGLIKDNGKTLLKGAIRAGVHENFVVDAWLGNWDVVGLNYDNLLIKDGVKAIRIDVGGGLQYRAQGLAKGQAFGKEVTELSTLRNPGVNPQAAKVFGNITQAELETGAMKVLSITDEKIRDMVNLYGPVGRGDKEKLIELLIERKKYIQKEFPHLQVEVKAPLPLDIGKRISDFEFNQIVDSRVNGYTIKIDKEFVEDQQVLFWVEKDTAGNPFTCAQFKLREGGLEKAKALLGGADADMSFETDDIYNSILDTFRGVSQQVRNNQPLRQRDIDRAIIALRKFGDGIEKLKKSNLYLTSNINAFSNKYVPWAERLQQVISTGVGNRFEMPDANTFKNVLTPFGNIKLKKIKAVEFKLAKTRSDFKVKKAERGFVTRTDNKLPKANNEIKFTWTGEVDGVKFEYWPDDESVPTAMRGLVRVETKGKTIEQVEKILKTVEEKISIEMKRATEIDQEFLYLRQIARARNTDLSNKMLQDVEFMKGSDEEKIKFLQKKLMEEIGYDITKVKGYDKFGVAKTFGTGRINVYRPDLETAEFEDFRKNYKIGKSTNMNPKILETMLDNGGEMVSNVERTRKGFDLGGVSPEGDLRTGGANYFFTRITKNSRAVGGEFQMVWETNVMKRADIVSYPRDKWGNTSPEILKTRKGTVPEWIENAGNTRSETNFKQSLSIFDRDFLCLLTDTVNEKKALIEVMKKHNYLKWPDGRKLEDVILTYEEAKRKSIFKTS